MNQDPTEYSVVIPAYLEEENLRLLLPRICEVMEEWGEGSWEVLIIDTIKPLDQTAAVCETYGARHIQRGPTNCFGDAMRTGLAAARGRWIIWMDADGSHTPEFIPELLKKKDSSDIIIASRYVEGGYSENSKMLKMMSRLLNLTYAVILNLPCNDVSNGFKVYRSEYIRNLSLRSDNFDIIEEVLFKAKKAHPEIRFAEVPFSFKKRMFGETKRNLLAFICTYVITLIKLRYSR